MKVAIINIHATLLIRFSLTHCDIKSVKMKIHTSQGYNMIITIKYNCRDKAILCDI